MSIVRRSIASSLASAFLSENMAAPSGERAIQSSAWLLPDSITQTPCVLVFPPTEDLTYPPSSRHSSMDWPVRLYLWSDADTYRRTDSLYLWSDVVYDQLDSRVHLALESVVTNSDIVGMRAGRIEYAGEMFHGIEFVVRTTAEEGITFSG